MGPIWPNYYSDARALVFLLDGSQPGSWQEAGAKLRDILAHRHMKVRQGGTSGACGSPLAPGLHVAAQNVASPSSDGGSGAPLWPQGKPCLVVLNKLDASGSKPADLERSAQQALGWHELQAEVSLLERPWPLCGSAAGRRVLTATAGSLSTVRAV